MAKVLNKTGIDTNKAIIADYVNNTTNALTGVNAYDITISGSSTVTSSLDISGSINIVGGGSNVNATTISGSGIAATSQIASIGDFTIKGNTSLGNAIEDTTTIKGNITGSGNITLSSSVSASIIIGKANSLSFANTDGAIDQTMTTSAFPPGSVIGINARGGDNAVEFTLPTPVGDAGLEYTFISNNNPSGGSTTMKIHSLISSLLNGIAICDDGTKDITSDTTFGFAAEKFFKGTRICCISDGTIWHVTAFCLCDLTDVT